MGAFAVARADARSDDGAVEGNDAVDAIAPLRAHQFADWTKLQGREDAEMLHEKQQSKARFRSLQDYERAWDEV